MKKETIIKELQVIPGVGKSIAEDLYLLGIHAVKDLKNKNPEALYEKLCAYEGRRIDRCMLYVFRCAIYFASNTRHDKNLLLWWHWSDAALHNLI